MEHDLTILLFGGRRAAQSAAQIRRPILGGVHETEIDFGGGKSPVNGNTISSRSTGSKVLFDTAA